MNECCTDTHVNSYEFKWTIKKFIVHVERAEQKKSRVIERSSYFSIGGNNNTNWRLQLQVESPELPNSDIRNVFIRFYALCSNIKEKQEMWVRFTSYFLKKNDEKFSKNCQLTKITEEENWVKLMKKDKEFLTVAGIKDLNDDLKIVCTIDVIGDTTMSTETYLYPKKIESNLSGDFAKLLDNAKFTDVTFLLFDEKIKAHKSILIARSPVFAAMFEHPQGEKIENVMNIDDIEIDVFKKMLRYIYTNEVHDIDDCVKDMLYAADKYELNELKEICGASIWKRISVDNAVEAYMFANRHNLEQLMKLVQNFINININKVIETAGYKSIEEEHPQLANIILRNSLKRV